MGAVVPAALEPLHLLRPSPAHRCDFGLIRQWKSLTIAHPLYSVSWQVRMLLLLLSTLSLCLSFPDNGGMNSALSVNLCCPLNSHMPHAVCMWDIFNSQTVPSSYHVCLSAHVLFLVTTSLAPRCAKVSLHTCTRDSHIPTRPAH